MTLKCPICGEEYFHDSKICQICERNSNYSELINIHKYKSKKWNWGIFLEIDKFSSDNYKPDDAYIRVTSEPKLVDFKPKKGYIWNCNSQTRDQNFYILRSGISQLKNVKKIPLTRSNIQENQKFNSLIYE
ncbi:MAG: hypothetical protein ACFFAV_07300 [Candidatus Hermodarchaeota archaeon]